MGYPSPYRGEYHHSLQWLKWRISRSSMLPFLDKACLLFSWCVPSGKRLHNYMENHHVQWVNPLFQWQFSIATLNYQRVLLIAGGHIILLLLLLWISYPYYNPFTVVASNWLHRLSGSAICWRPLWIKWTAGISTWLDNHLHLDNASTHNGVNKIPISH